MNRVAWGSVIKATLVALACVGVMVAEPAEALTALGVLVAYLAGASQRAFHHGRHMDAEDMS